VSTRIYVSSTFEDLREHRARVNEALCKLGHTDVAMEHYVAESRRPLARCLADVRASDLYVGVFAGRYGYVPPGSERSITEHEFREAERSERPVLCFLGGGADDDRLAALKREIEERYLIARFQSPDELATEVAVAVTRTLEWGRTPLDLAREHRLINEWRSGATRRERMRARAALANMGSPRYAAALKDLLLQANADHDVEAIADHLDALLTLAQNSDEVMPVIAELLEAQDVDRRVAAVFQIGELGLRGRPPPCVVLSSLLTRAADPEPAVRAELAHTLGKLEVEPDQRERVAAALEVLAQDRVEAVRTRAVQSLR
jgi:Domain of unknown function (DUF4062)/HEAT repeats